MLKSVRNYTVSLFALFIGFIIVGSCALFPQSTLAQSAGNHEMGMFEASRVNDPEVFVIQYDGESPSSALSMALGNLQYEGQLTIIDLHYTEDKILVYTTASQILHLEDLAGVLSVQPAQNIPFEVAQPTKAAFHPAAPTATGAITGVVKAQDTGLPMQGVSVALSPFDSWNTTYHYTDENGYFSFTDLAVGNYKLHFIERGQYAFEWYDNKLYSESADPIAVTSGVTVGLSIELVRGGIITGSVTAEDTGLPLSDISAYAAYEGGHSYWVSSNANGHYKIGGLAAGWYQVCFHDYDGNYASECYDNTSGMYVGDPVTVTAGVTLSVNAALSPAAVITGTVTASDNDEPLSNIEVNIYSADNQWRSLGSDTTDTSGTYRINGLAAGDYKIKFSDNTGSYLMEYYEDQLDFNSATLINVTSGTTTTVNAELTLGGQITGRVVDADTDTGIADVYVYVSGLNNSESADAYTDANGYYTTTAMRSGVYEVRFEPPSPYLREQYDNFSIWTDFTPVIVDAPATSANINAALEKGNVISGTVTALGQPVAGVQVRVYAEGDSYYDGYLTQYTATDGTYTIGPLTQERYYIEFVPPSDSPYAPQWYAGSATYADATPVVMPHTTSVNAELTVGSCITGIVTSAEGISLENIYVYIYEPGASKQIVDAQTDADGQYVSPALMPGPYQVKFSPPWDSQYASQWYSNTAEQGAADIITLTKDVTLTNINAQLPELTSVEATGAITGRVTAADTGQLVGTGACLYEEDPEQMLCGGWAQINNGAFTISGWEAGQYHLYFRAPTPYAPVFYKDAYTPEQASPITITANMTTTDINQVLQIGGNITGTVLAGSSSVPGTKVEISTLDEGQSIARLGGGGSWSLFQTRITYVGGSGAYQMPGLPGGTYSVNFMPPAPYIGQTYSTKQVQLQDTATAAIGVELGQVKPDINVTLAEGGVLTGTITAADTGENLAGTKITVYNLDEEVVSSATADMDGRYITSGLANGEYKVYFDNSAGYLAEWNSNAATFSTAPTITISGVGTKANINAVLEKGGTLSGYVYDQDSKLPIPYAQVEVYDAATGTQMGETTYTNGWGYYRRVGLAAGEYKLRFSYGEYTPRWYGNATTFDSATSVTVNLAQETSDIHGYLTMKEVSVSAMITKTVNPKDEVLYGDELTYTLVISSIPGTKLNVYDPLVNITYLRFLEQPDDVDYVDQAITGTVTITPTNQMTISFVAQVGAPSTIGVYADITNKACVYVDGESIIGCIWSNPVTNRAFHPYNVFLPLVMRR